ncbi:glycosyltransferase family 39 protein [Candidatus Woesearchaeota archaeon]|nr:glycosyltransferase family 39 protein [Candidatus Woesearchaeota archaeon]
MGRISAETKLMLVFLVPVAVIMILHYMVTGFVVYNDGRGYYSYLRSMVIDKDINFTNEWTYYNTTYSKFSAIQRVENIPSVKTKKGYLENIYLIGNAIMWAPFFLAAHALALLLNIAGLHVRADGFGFLYEAGIGIASLVYGLLGALLIYKLCRKWFEKKTALLATVAVWYGTAFFWYQSIEPSMSHINSMLTVTLFVYIWYTTLGLGKRTKLQWLLLGVLLGLVYLIRQQDALIGFLPGLELLKSLAGKLSFANLRKTVINSGLLGIGFLGMIFPQMLLWKEMYGSYIVNTYASSVKYNFYQWTAPQLLPLLLSTEAGLWRVPLLPLSMVGLFLFAKRIKGAAWYFLVPVAAQLLLTTSWSAWLNGYGLRFLLGMSVFFALGTAELIRIARIKAGMKPVYAAVAILVAANFVNMLAVMLKEVTSKVPLSEIPGTLIRALIGS